MFWSLLRCITQNAIKCNGKWLNLPEQKKLFLLQRGLTQEIGGRNFMIELVQVLISINYRI